MKTVLILAALLVAVAAETSEAGGFAGYERGGYEIRTGDSDSSQSPGFPSSGGFPDSNLLDGTPGQSGPGGTQDDFLQGGRQQPQSFGAGAGNDGDYSDDEGGDFQQGGRQQSRGSQRFSAGSSNDGNYRDDEDGGGDEGDLNDIPGVAGRDYPIYEKIPKTSFRCEDQASPGYYADVETQCQVFHICQKGGQMNSVLCPNGTIFNQKVFVCSWWYDFDCDLAVGLFSLNAQVTAEGEAAAARQGSGGAGYAQSGHDGGDDGGQRQGSGGAGYAQSGHDGGGDGGQRQGSGGAGYAQSGQGGGGDGGNVFDAAGRGGDLMTSEGYPAGPSSGYDAFSGIGNFPGADSGAGSQEGYAGAGNEQGYPGAGSEQGYPGTGSEQGYTGSRDGNSGLEGSDGTSLDDRSYLPPS